MCRLKMLSEANVIAGSHDCTLWDYGWWTTQGIDKERGLHPTKEINVIQLMRTKKDRKSTIYVPTKR